MHKLSSLTCVNLLLQIFVMLYCKCKHSKYVDMLTMYHGGNYCNNKNLDKESLRNSLFLNRKVCINFKNILIIMMTKLFLEEKN